MAWGFHKVVQTLGFQTVQTYLASYMIREATEILWPEGGFSLVHIRNFLRLQGEDLIINSLHGLHILRHTPYCTLDM